MDSLFEAIEEKLRANGIIDRLSCSVRAEVLQILKHPESRQKLPKSDDGLPPPHSGLENLKKFRQKTREIK